MNDQFADSRKMVSHLPNDVARCNGVGDQDGWREGCDDCLRRTAPRSERTVMIGPPVIIAFECDFRIEPESPR